MQRLEYFPCKISGISNTGYALQKLCRLSEKLPAKHRAIGSSVPSPGSSKADTLTLQGLLTELSDQIRRFYNKATHVYEELGPSAASYFIFRTVEMIRNKAKLAQASAFYVKKEDRMVYQLRDTFDQEGLTQAPDILSLQTQLSPKLERLIAFLDCQKPEECSGLIFVQQRATVSVLCTILSNHPQTMSRFKCATFVGLSNSTHGKLALCELFDKEAQKDTILEFRAGKKNIVIATDALEEGIDVAACNLVVCFNTPPNLKSYIQRRGRARMHASQYVMMVPTDSIQSKLDSWPELEDALIKMYQDDDRARAKIALLENEHESVDDWLSVEATEYVTSGFS
jgi:ERCC4-related helicase